MHLGLLILRVVVGVLVIGHGAQKLFGWFGGYGVKGTSGMMASKGFSPAAFWTVLGSLSEFVGGLLLVLGFLNPLGSIAIAAAMLTAIAAFHWPKVWASSGGFEYPLVILTSVIAVGSAGPGAYSLDAVLGTSVPTPVTIVVAALAALGFLTAIITSARTSRSTQGTSGNAAA